MSPSHRMLATAPGGYVAEAPCGCCLHLRYGRLFWRLSREEFDTFGLSLAELVSPEGFARNEAEPGLALLTMAGDRQGALLNLSELKGLHHLVGQAGIGLARQSLEASWQRLKTPN